jgi:hypothetical protein
MTKYIGVYHPYTGPAYYQRKLGAVCDDREAAALDCLIRYPKAKIVSTMETKFEEGIGWRLDAYFVEFHERRHYYFQMPRRSVWRFLGFI